jgi:tetratricopeptide (TPR) repeat protein
MLYHYESALQKTIGLKQMDTELSCLYANVLVYQGKYDQAFHLYQKAMDSGCREYELYLPGMVACLLNSKQLDQAEEYLQLLPHHEPNLSSKFSYFQAMIDFYKSKGVDAVVTNAKHAVNFLCQSVTGSRNHLFLPKCSLSQFKDLIHLLSILILHRPTGILS